MSMNIIAMRGRLATDAKLNYTKSGTAVTSGRLAVERNFVNAAGERVTDFFQFVVWGKQAENFSSLVKKGDRVGLDGHLQTRYYEKDGQTIFVTEIFTDHFDLIETRGASKPTSTENQAKPEQPAPEVKASPFSEPDDDDSNVTIADDDLPF